MKDFDYEAFDAKAKVKISQITPEMVEKEGDFLGVVVWIKEVGEVTILKPEEDAERIGEYWKISTDSPEELDRYVRVCTKKSKSGT